MKHNVEVTMQTGHQGWYRVNGTDRPKWGKCDMAQEGWSAKVKRSEQKQGRFTMGARGPLEKRPDQPATNRAKPTLVPPPKPWPWATRRGPARVGQKNRVSYHQRNQTAVNEGNPNKGGTIKKKTVQNFTAVHFDPGVGGKKNEANTVV